MNGGYAPAERAGGMAAGAEVYEHGAISAHPHGRRLPLQPLDDLARAMFNLPRGVYRNPVCR